MDRYLHQPIRNERSFSSRLGQCASAEWQGTWQATLGPLVVNALLTSVREHLGAAIDLAQRRVLAQPLWMIWPCGSCAPDVAMIDAEDRILLVAEVKGPHSPVQWTPVVQLRQITTWASSAGAKQIRHWIQNLDPRVVERHGVTDEDCTCWAPRRARDGLHTESLHQGDVYWSSRAWVPNRYTVHPDCTWLALLPHRRVVDKWQNDLRSSDEWAIASVPALLTALRAQLDTPPSPLTDWEHQRLTSLVEGGETLYTNALPGSRRW